MEPGIENLNATAAPARTPVIGRLVRLMSGNRAPDLEELAEALPSEKGESSAVALARQILDRYEKATSQQRAAFLAALAERFGASEAQLEHAIAQYRADPTPRNQAALHAAAELAAVAEYVLRARDRAGRVIDPVARFHLNNGARLERINWCGDTSSKGLAQAAGFMVNYLYELDDIERNHEVFVRNNLVVAARPVRRHLRNAAR